MKTSIMALVAASLFLVVALTGVGSGTGSPPPAPDMIMLSGPPRGVPSAPGVKAVPTPATSTEAPAAGQPQVVAVGRSVQQRSLTEILVSPNDGTGSSGGLVEASGPTAQQSPSSVVAVQTTLDPTASPASTEPAGTQVSPSPAGTPYTVTIPSPKPKKSPAPKPTPTPSPTPLVTVTVTPTSTATPTPSP